MLANKYSFPAEQLSQIIPTIAGLLAAVLFLIIVTLAFNRLKKKRSSFSWGALTLLAFFALGLLLSPTPVFGKPPEEDCGGDVIATVEAAGRHLASLVPPGSTVFWDGGLSPAPLLYLKEIKIFGAQLMTAIPSGAAAIPTTCTVTASGTRSFPPAGWTKPITC
jgi:hypothetical protein